MIEIQSNKSFNDTEILRKKTMDDKLMYTPITLSQFTVFQEKIVLLLYLMTQL